MFIWIAVLTIALGISCGGRAKQRTTAGSEGATRQAGTSGTSGNSDSAPQHAATPPADRIPIELQLVGGNSTALFDAAYASDWDGAKESVGALEAAEDRLRSPMPDTTIADQIFNYTHAAKDDVRDRNRPSAMDDANKITRAVADLAEKFRSGATARPMLLGYYGRQLEIGLVANRPELLRRATADLKGVWRDVQPELERRGDTEDDKRFTDALVALDGAKRPRDYVAPTRAELAVADRIAKALD